MNNFPYSVSRVWPSTHVQDIQAPNRSREHAKRTAEKQSPGMPRFAVGPPYSVGFSWQCYQLLIVSPAFLLHICPNFVPSVLATTELNLTFYFSVPLNWPHFPFKLVSTNLSQFYFWIWPRYFYSISSLSYFRIPHYLNRCTQLLSLRAKNQIEQIG